LDKPVPGDQSVHHFGFAAVCWAIWKCRNKAVFDAKTIRHLAEILLYACSFMKFWAGLYNSDLQGRLIDGVKALRCWPVLTRSSLNRLEIHLRGGSCHHLKTMKKKTISVSAER